MSGMNRVPLHGSIVSLNPVASPGAPTVLRLQGKSGGHPATLGIDESTLSRHMMLLGGTGSGKTTLFFHIVSQLRRRMGPDDVMVIFDSKGDFHSRFHQPGDLIIGNSQQVEKHSARWNLFKEIVADGWDDRRICVNAQEIARSLFQERLEGNAQPFFPNAARDVLSAVLIAFLRRARSDAGFRADHLFNEMLMRFFQELDENAIPNLLAGHADLQAVRYYLGAQGSDQGLGVIAELQSIIRDLLIGVFSDRGMFSMRDFIRKKGGRVLFVEYDLSTGSVLTPIYRLLFDLAFKEALGRSKSEGNVYMICDEFKLLPHLQHVDDGVNFGRSLGVRVMAGIQSIEQLYEIYGESRGRNIAAGFSTVVGFRCNDKSSRDYISGLHGENMVLEQYQNLHSAMSEERRVGKTVEDWDMLRLKVGQAIVGLPGAMPFVFQFDDYL
jgi:type IV secretory pathway TraG/TraD family ATPase VirD4